MEEVKLTELSEETIDKIALKLSEQLFKMQQIEKRKIANTALYNTKLLLKNYDKLKKHCEIVDEQVTEELGTLWSDWRFDLNTLLEHKAKTAKLMRHVDKALEVFKENDEQGYYLLKRKYMTKNAETDDMTIACEYDIERRTLTKRLKKACDDLSVLLFGIAAIDKK